MRCLKLLSAAGVLAVILSACGGKPSAVQQSSIEGVQAPAQEADSGASADRRDTAEPQINGRPMWASNRTHTAEENARYQFTRNGGDFSAVDERDYVTKAHAFIDNPPGDIQTLDRPNGDKLLYDAKGNVFVVVSRDGAPRTMFKPRGGATYWQQQKDRESQRDRSAAARDQIQG